jgi:hypothetical protein
MRTLVKRLSSSFFILIISFSALARPVAQVVDVSGVAFVVNKFGKTKTLKKDQQIDEYSEVLVEEGAALTFNDYYNTSYHSTGGSHLKFFNKSIQLKKGKSWVKSMTSKYPLSITTANGQVDFTKGEFIVTFDQTTNRSQYFVVNGEVEVSNILNKETKYQIPAGSFSFIDPDVDNGIPRTPTKVGLQSLESALSEFNQLPEKIFGKKNVLPKPTTRTIASVSENKKLEELNPIKEPATLPTDLKEAPVIKKGEIIYLTTHRKPASVEEGMAHNYYKKIVNKKRTPTKVKIKIFGSAWIKPQPPSRPLRTPASIKVIGPSVEEKKPKETITNDPEFEISLKKHEAQQPKYSKELGNLIDELKSY